MNAWRAVVCAVLALAVLLGLAMSSAGCKQQSPAAAGSFAGEGTVHRGVGPECPDTWHVATTDGHLLWPVENAAFQVEGLQVRFGARPRQTATSICMAGTMVDFVKLEKR